MNMPIAEVAENKTISFLRANDKTLSFYILMLLVDYFVKLKENKDNTFILIIRKNLSPVYYPKWRSFVAVIVIPVQVKTVCDEH